ncbi:MAG: hypothetical protein ACRDRS_05585 [Pseudonocardiaceae bacterium]
MVPGLLQTGDYARALISRPATSPSRCWRATPRTPKAPPWPSPGERCSAPSPADHSGYHPANPTSRRSRPSPRLTRAAMSLGRWVAASRRFSSSSSPLPSPRQCGSAV